MRTGPGQVLASLTGIRFIAAIFVFNGHMGNPPGGSDLTAGLSVAGHDWMTMFFILSGLILTWNYDDSLGTRLTGRGLRTFFVARFARIYPLYLFVLAIVALTLVHVPGDLLRLVQNPALLAHVLTVQTWSPDLAVAYGFNGPGYSVGIEFFLYALFPFLLIPFRRIRSNPRALLLVAAIAIAVGLLLTALTFPLGIADLAHENPLSAHRWLYRTPVTRIPDFVLGISLGYLLIATRDRDLTRPGRVLQLVGAITVLGSMLIPPLALSIWSLDSANMIPFALLLPGLVWSPDTRLARFLGSPPLMLLGESAYAFYLWHQPIVNFVGRPDQSTTAWAVCWIVAFAITTLVAVGAHLVIERPARIWLRRVLGGGPGAGYGG
ncbi:MAG: acyltransferase 3 [Schumannella sp.]|nr:acyltransferase 3 [Schumannella sp.]